MKKNFDGLRLAVLDGERLKAEAICFKSHEKIAQMVADVLSKVKESESQIKEEYEKIKSSKKLTQEQKLSETAKIEAKWNTVFTRYNAEIQSIRNKDLLLSEHIQRKLTSIIDAITRSAKLDVVVNKGNRDIILVFHNSKDIDITDLVICRLNKEVPSVDIGGIKDD
ncbi:MAG: OmpH family outer membrane protein [Holosporales bacterium]|nr:OmpH family outer membrane protein [Holosporales bacterium]